MRIAERHEEERSVEAERPRGMGGLDRRNGAHSVRSNLLNSHFNF